MLNDQVLREAEEQALAPVQADDIYPLSFEIVYGVAFGPQEGQPRRTAAGEEATFSVEALRKSRPQRD